MPKKATYNQLSLLEQFDKTKDRQGLLVKQLISLIGLVKYYRTCTSYGDITSEAKRERLIYLNTILYWLAQLALKQSRGLEEYKDKDFVYFNNLTKDGIFLSMVDAMSSDSLSEFYASGAKRARTLLILSRDLLKHDIEMGTSIITNFDKLIKA